MRTEREREKKGEAECKVHAYDKCEVRYKVHAHDKHSHLNVSETQCILKFSKINLNTPFYFNA